VLQAGRLRRYGTLAIHLYPTEQPLTLLLPTTHMLHQSYDLPLEMSQTAAVERAWLHKWGYLIR